jgi:hypothetical protein
MKPFAGLFITCPFSEKLAERFSNVARALLNSFCASSSWRWLTMFSSASSLMRSKSAFALV